MSELTFNAVTADEIIDKATILAGQGFRLIQIHCTKTPTEMFLIYSLEKPDLTFENLKMDVQVGDTVPSISGVFFGAFLYENEIHDLYGVNISDMAVDFKGTFYQTSVKQAFSFTGSEKEE